MGAEHPSYGIGNPCALAWGFLFVEEDLPMAALVEDADDVQ